MDDFAERLAAATPTPGGGAAAARVGLYACALIRMAAGITLNKLIQAGARAQARAPAESADAELAASAIRAALEEAEELGERFQALETADVAAFQGFLDALRLPRGTTEEKERRLEARMAAAARATDVPVDMISAATDVLLLCQRLLELSRTTPLRAESDLGAAVELSVAVFRVAELNIKANLAELSAGKRESVLQIWKHLAARAGELYADLRRSFARDPQDAETHGLP